MDNAILLSAFTDTLNPNPNIRKQAESDIDKASVQEGFAAGCLQLTVYSKASVAVRQSAAIFLKNRIVHHWSPSFLGNDATKDPAPIYIISDNEKEIIRSRIVGMIVSSPDGIRSHLILALRFIIQSDYPNQWLNLTNDTIALLTTANEKSVFGGLICLYEITKYYRWTLGSARGFLHKIVDETFPLLIRYGNEMIDSGTDSSTTAELLRLILKIFKFVTYNELPPYFQTTSHITAWANLHLHTIQKPLPSEVLSIPEEDREEHPWLKCKKWAYANLARLQMKYGGGVLTQNDTKKNSQFYLLFPSTYVPEILNVYWGEISKWRSNEIWLSNPSLYHLVSLLEQCIGNKVTWALVLPQINTIISQIIFPLFKLTSDDLELFENEPDEYVRIKFDPYEEGTSPDLAASSFLSTVVEKRKKAVLNDILQFVNTVLLTYSNEKDNGNNTQKLNIAKDKDAALRIMGLISVILTRQNSPFFDVTEQFLEQFVIPDLNTGPMFLRARACDTISKFMNIRFKNRANISAACTGVLQCLTDANGNLPVQVEAALALPALIKNEYTYPSIGALVPQIVKKLLDLSNSIDLDTLAMVIEEFVDVFSTQLTPFAADLGQQLSDQFIRIMSELLTKLNDAPDDIEEIADLGEADKELAAASVLNAIITMSVTMDTSVELSLKLEEYFAPVMIIVLKNGAVEYLSETLGLLEGTILASKQVSSRMWNVFHVALKAVIEWAWDFLLEFLPIFENVLIYGANDLRNNPDLVREFYQFIEFATRNDQDTFEDSYFLTCQLTQFFIISLGDASGSFITDILTRVIKQYSILTAKDNTDESKPNEVHLVVSVVETCLAVIQYRPKDGLHFLQHINFLTPFFEIWFNNFDSFKRVYDLKLEAMALTIIVSLSENDMPPGLRDVLPQLFSRLVTVLSRLPTAIFTREETARKEDESARNSGLSDSYQQPKSTQIDAEGWDVNDANDDEDVEETTNFTGLDYYGNDSYYSEVDAEQLSENTLQETPLDNIGIFNIFKAAIVDFKMNNNERYTWLTSSLTAEEMNVVSSAIELVETQNHH